MTLEEQEELVRAAVAEANSFLTSAWEEGEELLEILSVSVVRLQIVDEAASVVSQSAYKRESDYL